MNPRKNWQAMLLEWFNYELPRDYMTFDLETTGFKKDFDLPIDFGWTLVRDCQIAHQGSYVLDWTRYPQYVELSWLQRQLDRLALAMREQGKPWRYSIDYLQEHGQDPFWVLEFVAELLEANRKAGSVFVGHNAAAYDSVLLCATLKEFVDFDWQFGDKELLDTGSLQKASLTVGKFVDPSNEFAPRPGETMGDFFRRIAASRREGVKWNIEACATQYQICERYGLCHDELHGAGSDSLVCHYCIEAHREEYQHAAEEKRAAAQKGGGRRPHRRDAVGS